MDFKLSIDVDKIAEWLETEVPNLHQKLHQAVALLAAATHAKVAQFAKESLKSTRDTYLDNLSWFQLSDTAWVVVLREPAMWIEDGKSPGSMIPDLLQRNTKTSKEGHQYRVIPIGHGTPPSRTSAANVSLEATLRTELRKQKIPLKKIERNPDGSPKLGLLHSLNIDSSFEDSQGNLKGVGSSGIPYLQGVRIYQNEGADGKAQRTIMTFRTVSSKHLGTEKWFHPGIDPKHFMDRAFAWAEAQWYNTILPSLTE